MPVDRTLAEDLAAALVDVYAAAERRLAAGLALRLASGLDEPQWASAKLAAIGEMRRWSATLVARLERETGPMVAQQLALAFARGGDSAMAEIARLQSTHAEWMRHAGVTEPSPRLLAAIQRRQAALDVARRGVEHALPGGQALNRLVHSLASRLSGTRLPILRWAEDAYRAVVATDALPSVLLGTTTRRRATQVAWEELLTRGVTGFTDKAGRRWNLASYVEMATRTGVAQAAVEGHLDRLASAGLDLVIVSNAPQECQRCRPWEGKILTRDGADRARAVSADHATEDRAITVHVAGSVQEAIKAGLLHPNCRHSLNAYLPGLTTIPTDTADPEGDAARQRLRALERAVRAAKLKQAAALTPEAGKAAGARARELQGQIREHVAASADLGIMRKPERERINLGHTSGG